MSSIAIKPYASIKGTNEYVGAVVTFCCKTAKVPGTAFTVSWNGAEISTLSPSLTNANFVVDFGNNIPFKNSSSVEHATPITIDRTNSYYDGSMTDHGLTNTGYIFAETSGNTPIMTATSNITIGNGTPSLTNYQMTTTANPYFGIWITSGSSYDKFNATNFFANPSGLTPTILNYNLTSTTAGSARTLSTSSMTSYTAGNRFDNTALTGYTVYSIILPPTSTVDATSELKFEDAADTLNDSAVSFRLLSTVLQSIKTTCGAPTKKDGSDGTGGQYINNNSVTLHCFATRYIQYNTQNTTYGNNQVSIEPGNETICLPSRALWNTGTIASNQCSGTSKSNTTGSAATAMVVAYSTGSTSVTGDISGLKDAIDGTNNAINYHTSGTANISSYTGSDSKTYWYATVMYKSSSAIKNIYNALNKTFTLNGHFSNSNAKTSGDYDSDGKLRFLSPASTADWSVTTNVVYDATQEGTIPNISGWVNEMIYLFPQS